ncbi:hypothetical protein LTR36_010661 [Oleoguttula mirabilis]|uniref:Cytochrome P450 monooxygenase n=1 Tax=Oleoguttula mirabilis TaxID=1507867 RepID=A0AAV9JSG1_9PEZI|nr:hypothetical protein LTR36_010661 [Oleoguttula mirabilis]
MDALDQLPATKPFALMGTFAVLSVIYFTGKLLYALYFDPLNKIPGPAINRISRIPYVKHLLAGTTAENVTELHKKYGEVVRISPNEVSFTSGETAWPDIYGFRTGSLKGHVNMQKDSAWYAPPVNGVPSLLIANDADHTRVRRTLSHAFSEKALAEQEVLLQTYVDQLINRLQEVTSASDEPVDMVKWYNWTTFDIIADLLFGEPFGCLQDLRTHRYIELLFRGLQGFRMFYVISYFPWVKYLSSLIVDKSMIAGRIEYTNWVAQQARTRIARDTQRPDFMTHILKHNGEKPEATITQKEIEVNCLLILTAGSETTATTLSATTYLLLKDPQVYQKLKDEVRGLWKTYGEITLEAVNNAPYLIAVLQEGLRYFPPVPTGFERRVGKGGEVVSGYFMPEDTALCVSQYPTYHSERNFKDPEALVPQRWMGDPKYADDKRSACQPFSFGPRNCLGKNLAYAEMRLIMAKIVWSFDFELDAQSANWMAECKVLTLWAKPELVVRVKEVVRA